MRGRPTCRVRGEQAGFTQSVCGSNWLGVLSSSQSAAIRQAFIKLPNVKLLRSERHPGVLAIVNRDASGMVHGVWKTVC